MLRNLAVKALAGALGYWRTGPAKLTDPALPDMLGGGRRTFAGKAVTVDTALSMATVRACVTLIAETIATLPFNTYETGPDGRRLARSHPLYGLLHDAPNADQTSVEFWEMMAAGLLLWGNAYAVIDRVFGRVVALTPVSPAHVSVRRADDGSLLYTIADGTASPHEVGEGDMLHIRAFSLDGITGISPIAQQANALALAQAAEETAGSLFKNGLRIGGYLAGPDVLTDTQRRDAHLYLRRFQGAAAAGEIPVLEGNWKFQPFSIPPQEAELLATRGFSVEEIARIFRVPLHMIGHHTKDTSWGSGIEQQQIGFVTLTLRPWLKRIEMACKRRLLAPGERGTIELEFNVAALLRGDAASRAAFYTAMVTNGIYTRDECRDLENMPRRGGGAALLTVQSQNVPIDLAAGLAAPPVMPAPARPAPAGAATAAANVEQQKP